MLEQKLHGAFSRFPSLSHTNLTMQEVSGLGNRKNEDTSRNRPATLLFPKKTARLAQLCHVKDD
jgi:hypothetical protein